MVNELQTALIPLAEKAGVDVYNSGNVAAYALSSESEYVDFFGADGTLTDPEVTMVLGWLAKAGCSIEIFDYEHPSPKEPTRHKVVLEPEDSEMVQKWSTVSLNTALAASVLALPQE